MTRIFDIFFSLLGLIILSPILLVLLLIGLFDTGSPLFRQKRIGVSQKPFHLLKFRSMHLNTQAVATHLDMSFVGPRPNLFNQTELIEERAKRGVYSIRPGITGLAQIQKIDMSIPQLLAETDAKMIKNLSVINYFFYIFKTLLGRGFGDRVSKSKLISKSSQ